MEDIYLSKSKYCKGVQCNKILWLDKNMPQEADDTANEFILKKGTKVGELARCYFGDFTNIEWNENLSKMIEDTLTCLENEENIITEASFTFENNFCSVDILKNNKDGFDIYEVKSSSGIKDIYLDDISYQVYVLNNLGYKIKSANLMYINKDYVRYGNLNLQELFIIKDVTEIAFSKQEKVKNKIQEINDYMKNVKEPEEEIGIKCLEPYDCSYWKYCTKKLPEVNIFSINMMNKKDKFKLYNKGIYSYEDLIKEDLNDRYRQQIEVELTKQDVIDQTRIKDFLQTLYYPLYFLDFETYQNPIPEYDCVRPNEQIPFQYSLHYIEKENGRLEHKEFLAQIGEDPRRKIAESLVENIPTDVCVTAYSMGFEKTVIKKLAEQYEDLRDHLLKIYNNIKDLIIPFRSRMYYNKQMEGSYSIKKVLPALFPDNIELNYHNLPIVHNGSEASGLYLDMKEKSKEEQKKIRQGLLKYCELDTYAMVKVWEKLKEAVGEK